MKTDTHASCRSNLPHTYANRSNRPCPVGAQLYVAVGNPPLGPLLADQKMRSPLKFQPNILTEYNCNSYKHHCKPFTITGPSCHQSLTQYLAYHNAATESHHSHLTPISTCSNLSSHHAGQLIKKLVKCPA